MPDIMLSNSSFLLALGWSIYVTKAKAELPGAQTKSVSILIEVAFKLLSGRSLLFGAQLTAVPKIHMVGIRKYLKEGMEKKYLQLYFLPPE